MLYHVNTADAVLCCVAFSVMTRLLSAFAFVDLRDMQVIVVGMKCWGGDRLIDRPDEW